VNARSVGSLKEEQMDNGTAALAISGILALIRIHEFVRSLPLGLSIKPTLKSDPEMGNDILVLNASSNPVNIYYLDLVWVERRWSGWNLPAFRKVVESTSPLDVDYCDITIPPKGQDTLPFKEGDHFYWGSKLLESAEFSVVSNLLLTRVTGGIRQQTAVLPTSRRFSRGFLEFRNHREIRGYPRKPTKYRDFRPRGSAEKEALSSKLKHHIYLRLWLVNRRRPVWFCVTGPGS
jgi:hypothetical protein